MNYFDRSAVENAIPLLLNEFVFFGISCFGEQSKNRKAAEQKESIAHVS